MEAPASRVHKLRIHFVEAEPRLHELPGRAWHGSNAPGFTPGDRYLRPRALYQLDFRVVDLVKDPESADL